MLVKSIKVIINICEKLKSYYSVFKKRYPKFNFKLGRLLKTYFKAPPHAHMLFRGQNMSEHSSSFVCFVWERPLP